MPVSQANSKTEPFFATCKRAARSAAYGWNNIGPRWRSYAAGMDPEIVCVRLSYWRFSETKLRFDLLQLFESLILASLNVKCLGRDLDFILIFCADANLQ